MDSQPNKPKAYTDCLPNWREGFMVEEQEEMKCPKCGGYMKEYVTCFRCRRNGNDEQCKFVFKSFFHAPANIQQQVQADPVSSQDSLT
jgi:predicted RNA-binding Zn-ribbon protein involved in translation (DUF1610 family)